MLFQKRLNEDDRSWIGKYAFSIANGNHILRYTEVEYREFLTKNPSTISKLFLLNFATGNLSIKDSRRFKNLDEQYLSGLCDPEFKSNYNFESKDLSYSSLRHWQKTVVDFTDALVVCIPDFTALLISGTPLEFIYAVLANVILFNPITGNVINHDQAIARALEMSRSQCINGFKPEIPFAQWELVII